MSVSIWRAASMTPRLFGIPCTAFLPIFGWLFHMRWWTFYTAVGTILAFAILHRFGLTFTVLYRKTMSWLRGQRIYARPWWYRNRFRDLD